MRSWSHFAVCVFVFLPNVHHECGRITRNIEKNTLRPNKKKKEEEEKDHFTWYSKQLEHYYAFVLLNSGWCSFEQYLEQFTDTSLQTMFQVCMFVTPSFFLFLTSGVEVKDPSLSTTRAKPKSPILTMNFLLTSPRQLLISMLRAATSRCTICEEIINLLENLLECVWKFWEFVQTSL